MTWPENLAGVRAGHPLAPHTTYRIGGTADWYLEASDGLAGLVSESRRAGIPLTLLGNGSNLLIADEGVEGLVVRPADTSIDVRGDVIHAAAGARMVKVAQAAEKAGLTGIEWALGIPGTVGGSAYNNAGCFGSDMAATVDAVEGIDARGAAGRWTNHECGFRYRGSAFRDGHLVGALVTAVTFRLRAGTAPAIKARMDEIQQERRRTQPVSGRSTGSVFKNPPGDYAGRLVEAAGLKGAREGGAMVSPEHANFIVNAGGATAGDVKALVTRVQAEVERLFGIRLEPEMESVGRWSTEARV